MIKVCIYTVVLNQYDFIFPPIIKDKNIEFILISDDVSKSVKGWKTIPVKESLKGMSAIMVNRYYKMKPHEFFSNYDLSIYIDGNIAIVGTLQEFIENFYYSKFLIGLIKHPNVLNAKEDINHCIKLKKISDPKQIKKEYQSYINDGFLDTDVYTENNIIIRKHNDPSIIKAMELWWDCFQKSFSKRDQISLPYVRQKMNLKAKIYNFDVRKKFFNFGKEKNLSFRLYPHRSKKTLQNFKTFIYVKSFNSKIFKLILITFESIIKTLIMIKKFLN